MSVDDAWIQRSCAPHARCPLKDRPEHVLTTRCRIAGQFEWGLCVLLAWPVLVDLFLIVWPLASKSWHWIQWLAIRRWSNFYLGSTWVKLYLGLCFRFKSICCVTWAKDSGGTSCHFFVLFGVWFKREPPWLTRTWKAWMQCEVLLNLTGLKPI
jgi:hypothetical protein